jgi:hypothetical protein
MPPATPPTPPAVVCSISAAASYALPANIVLAVADMEAGRPGLWLKNANGTYDVGPMQFNTAYLKTLAPYGITADAVAGDDCYAYQLAAWRLRKHIREDRGDLWTRVADYHSTTPELNALYRAGVIRRARYWERYLAAHFRTFEMAMPLLVNGNTSAAASSPHGLQALAYSLGKQPARLDSNEGTAP